MERWAVIFCSILFLNLSHAQERGIINSVRSPHVRLKSINIGDCQWTSGFWADKFRLCEEVMVPHMGRILKGDVGHAYNNFKIAAGLKQGEHQGMRWHDGDFYKWMEAATYVYAVNKDPRIREELDEIIAVIGRAQEEDGYLSTQITLTDAERWSNRQNHELYNSGHLLTAACIHHRITGQRSFLDIAVKHADYLYRMFSPQPQELARFGFNQTQIMGLVELYRTTKDRRYLQLAEIFINMRGRSRAEPHPTVWTKAIGDMVQERIPLREETEAVGHAVLALYFYAGAADVYAETGEQALIDALDRLWDNVVQKKMYVTGACGQAHHGSSSRVDFVHEAFIDEYMMPNLTAYNETCANICNAMFSYRMLGIHGQAKYADIIELVMYNSALSGISVDGTLYIYSNPLRVLQGARDYSKLVTETPTRQPYLECFCCPPNLVRTIAKLSGWAYSLSENGVAVNLYGGNRLDTHLLDGSRIHLTQETQYPWQGHVNITIESCKEEPFEVLLRVPEWAEGTKIFLNGKAADVEAIAGTYARIERRWKSGDAVTLDMPMDIRLIEGHPRIEEVRNHAALKRGPVVYCLETPDLPANTSVLDAYLPADVKLKARYRPGFLGGLTTLSGNVLLRSSQMQGMYHTLTKPDWRSVETTFVPYYAWCNRGPSEMTVWMPVVWGYEARVAGVCPASDPSNAGGWVLRADMSDEFEGDRLDPDKWYVEGTDGQYKRWVGRAPSQFSANNVRVENGKLHITTKWEPDFAFSSKVNPKYKSPYETYTTGAVLSRETFLYGYMEIKCKAADAAITSSFWATGKGSELDVFEFVGDSKRGDKDKRYPFATHDWSTGDGQANVWKDSVELDWRVADDFHVYGCEWSENGLKFYADGQLVKAITRAEMGKAWILTQPLMIWVDSETFYWEGFPDEKDLPVDFEIEYIRVWQRK